MSYATAKIQRRFTVLGVKLLPFSIGHRLILEACQSNLLISDAPVTRSELIAAVLVCSRSFEAGQRLRFGLLQMLLWRWRARKLSVEVETEKFRQYLAEGSQFPPLTGGGNGRVPGGPFLLRLVQWLQSQGISEQSAWNRPLGAAAWEWATYHEEQGGLKIQNEDDREFMSWVAEQEEAKNGI